MPKNAISASKKVDKSAVTLFPRPPSPKSNRSKSKLRKKSSSSDRSGKTPSTTRSKSVTPASGKKDSIPGMMASKTPQMRKVSDTLAPPGVFHSLGGFSKVSTPATPSDDGSIMASEVEEHETSQMWILRHLRLHLEDVNDSVLANFVLQQDITPFINFMMDFRNEKKCLFIIVSRYEARPVATPTIVIDEPAPPPPVVKEEPKPVKISITKSAGGSGKKMIKLKAKSKKQKAAKKAEETKIADQERESTSRQQIIDEIVEHERLAVPSQEGTVQLRWSDARAIPEDSEYVFVVSRMKERRSERSELDQQYFTGYIKNSQAFKRVNEIAHQIFVAKMNFEREIDLLLYAVAAMSNNIPGREKWQNPDENFENFICDALGHAFWQPTTSTGRNDSIISLGDQRSAVESVESLLRPRIQAFVKDPVSLNCIKVPK
uniref:Uncharacterized protein n=1 Tax=Panagrellus redivivus TaxID=6233 RepID=A0A7E4W5D1_PANRE